MGDAPSAVNEKNLQAEITSLGVALQNEIRERKKGEADAQQQIIAVGMLLSDHSEMISDLIKYMGDLSENYTDKSLALQAAICEFNLWMNLKENDRTLSIVWNAAFTMLAATFPALRLFPQFKAFELKAAAELIGARALVKHMKIAPSMDAKILAKAAKVGDIADVAGKLGDIKSKLTVTDNNPFALIDYASAPIDDLIDDYRQSKKAIDTIIDNVGAEFEARLYSVMYNVPYDKGTGESLRDLVGRLLPPIVKMDKNRRHGLTQSFLWLIVKSYVAQNVVVSRNWSGQWSGLDGMNHEQLAKLDDMFGLQSDWAYTLPVTVIPPGVDVLQTMGARVVRSSVYPPR